MTPAQLEALRKNAAKGRKKLAAMRKAGMHIQTAKDKREKGKTVEIPLHMVPGGPPAPIKRKVGKHPALGAGYGKKEGVADRKNVDALAMIIVSTWEELLRRRGA